MGLFSRWRCLSAVTCHNRPSIHPMCQWLRFILASRPLCVNTHGVTTVRFVSLGWSVCPLKKKRRRDLGKQRVRKGNLHVLESIVNFLSGCALLLFPPPIIHVAFNQSVQTNSICATALPAENKKTTKPGLKSIHVEDTLSTSCHIALNVSLLLCLWQIFRNVKKTTKDWVAINDSLSH